MTRVNGVILLLPRVVLVQMGDDEVTRGIVNAVTSSQRHGIGNRRMSNQAGGQMALAWWAIGAAMATVVALAIANVLLHWIALD